MIEQNTYECFFCGIYYFEAFKKSTFNVCSKKDEILLLLDKESYEGEIIVADSFTAKLKKTSNARPLGFTYDVTINEKYTVVMYEFVFLKGIALPSTFKKVKKALIDLLTTDERFIKIDELAKS